MYALRLNVIVMHQCLGYDVPEATLKFRLCASLRCLAASTHILGDGGVEISDDQDGLYGSDLGFNGTS